MKTIFILTSINIIDTKIVNGYFIGAVIALLILGYLLFALLKPEKF
jgi:K+-transporting ATPase KdpF subunit